MGTERKVEPARRVELACDTISKPEIDALRAWLGTYPRLTKGEVTLQFEAAWSRKLGVGHSTFVNSGSSAILLALSSLIAAGRLAPGDRVVVPALSWLTDVSSVMNLGLEPVLCDSSYGDLALDLDALPELLDSTGAKAVVAVSVLGVSPDMPRLCRICRDRRVTLIEDVCESLGSDCGGIPLGAWGDVSVFSMYYGHHISTIEGGMVCTNDTSLHRVIHSMRSHGWGRDWPAAERARMDAVYEVDPFRSMYTFFYPGYNLRSTDLQAFIGLGQLERLDSIADKRFANFKMYQAALGHFNEVLWGAACHRSNRISNFAYPYVFKSEGGLKNAVAVLSEAGIECRPLIAGSMSNHPFMRGVPVRSPLPVASACHSKGLYLPNHADLTALDIERVCDVFSSVVEPASVKPPDFYTPL